jgi:hypothetical protein
LGLQVSEDHPEVTGQQFGALVGVKGVQNMCAAGVAMMAPFVTQKVADAQPEVFGGVLLIRTFLSALRMDLQLGRSVVQLALSYTDFEGAVP